MNADPLAAALQWAQEVATSSSPSSIATMKRQLLDADSLTLAESVKASLVDMSQAFELPDLAEAMRARAEKRAPQFPSRTN